MSWFLVLKLKNGLNSREFKRKKAKARALMRETEGETARKSKSRPAAYRLKKRKYMQLYWKMDHKNIDMAGFL